MNYKAVYRTAPATPGLLISSYVGGRRFSLKPNCVMVEVRPDSFPNYIGSILNLKNVYVLVFSSRTLLPLETLTWHGFPWKTESWCLTFLLSDCMTVWHLDCLNVWMSDCRTVWLSDCPPFALILLLFLFYKIRIVVQTNALRHTAVLVLFTYSELKWPISQVFRYVSRKGLDDSFQENSRTMLSNRNKRLHQR